MIKVRSLEREELENDPKKIKRKIIGNRMRLWHFMLMNPKLKLHYFRKAFLKTPEEKQKINAKKYFS